MMRYFLIVAYIFSGINAYTRFYFSMDKDFKTDNELVCLLLSDSNSSVKIEPLQGFLKENQTNIIVEGIPSNGTNNMTEADTILSQQIVNTETAEEIEMAYLYHYPDGQVLRAELFNNKSGVHLPLKEMVRHGFAKLNDTSYYLQKAVNAFAILLYGTVDDVKRLPAHYMLGSARTISMMKIPGEKLAALWPVIKNKRKTIEVTFEELEMYRPLFRYVNAREIARLNLMDTKILNFIGTHPDLDRHQVGVVASRYISLNPNWTEVKYLNLMNNLLCGVPIKFMRIIPIEIYLQLSHQLFYHVRACDPLQRRFYLAMMTKTEALGKSYSWSSQDVSRLGLLLAEVEGQDLTAINPKSMAGIASQVMLEIPASNLEFFTDAQVESLALKPRTIFVRKIKGYQDSLHNSVNFFRNSNSHFFSYFIILITYL